VTSIMPDRPTWASTIGLFIINFGTLDLHVQDYLENNLSPEEFAKFKDCHFHDRVERVRRHSEQPGFAAAKREEFQQFALRLEPIRVIRNHIAHGLLRMSLAEDKKSCVVTISLPRDLAGSDTPAARHLTIEELLKASAELTELIEAFAKWEGTWVTDIEIRF
jgi:hypothetical protein